MARLFTAGPAGLLVLVLITSWAQAQDDVFNSLYGRGVHAYYAGQYEAAHALFNSAIKQDSRDPRCAYYRGLTYLKLERPDEAEDEFVRGAELEIAGSDGAYAVARSLERIQGKHRLRLETVRRQARQEILSRQAVRASLRYEQFQRDEAAARKSYNEDVPPSLPDSEDAPPTLPQDADVAKPDATDPFGGDNGGTLGTGKVEKADVKQPAQEEDDPFADPPAKADEVKKSPAKQPQPPAKAAVPKNIEDDPFGEDPFGEDPFGEEAPPKIPKQEGAGKAADKVKGGALRSIIGAVGKALDRKVEQDLRDPFGGPDQTGPPAGPPKKRPAPPKKPEKKKPEPSDDDDPFK